MPYTRTIRRHESIRVSGPATITLVSPARAKLSIDAPRDVTIEPLAPSAPDVLPFPPPPQADVDRAA